MRSQALLIIKNNVIIIALVVALLGGIIIEEMRISDLKESLATKSPDQAPVGVKDRRTESSNSSSLGDRNASGSQRSKTGERESDTPLEGFGKAMRKMADNPAAKAMFAQGHMSTVGSIYGPFLESLNLSEEEEKYSLGLLAGDFADQQQLGMKMMGAANAEERTALAEEMEANKEARKKEVADFLNDKEDQKSFDDYHERLTEHQQMPGIKARHCDDWK